MGRRALSALEWLRERAEDLYALLFWDGSGWKPPRKDRRNGM